MSNPQQTRKRRRQHRACHTCQVSHKGCDGKRPCQRCINLGIGHSCVPEETTELVERNNTAAAAPTMKQKPIKFSAFQVEDGMNRVHAQSRSMRNSSSHRLGRVSSADDASSKATDLQQKLRMLQQGIKEEKQVHSPTEQHFSFKSSSREDETTTKRPRKRHNSASDCSIPTSQQPHRQKLIKSDSTVIDGKAFAISNLHTPYNGYGVTKGQVPHNNRRGVSLLYEDNMTLLADYYHGNIFEGEGGVSSSDSFTTNLSDWEFGGDSSPELKKEDEWDAAASDMDWTRVLLGDESGDLSSSPAPKDPSFFDRYGPYSLDNFTTFFGGAPIEDPYRLGCCVI